MKSRNNDTDVENKLMDTKSGREDGMIRGLISTYIHIDIYLYIYKLDN